MATTDWSKWDSLKYRRRLETFGIDDGPIIASGPNGEFDAIWSAIHMPLPSTNPPANSPTASLENSQIKAEKQPSRSASGSATSTWTNSNSCRNSSPTAT